ncbi:MAG: helix-turn-helix domain-containing protein [Candidatus Fimousia sp.]
MIIYEPFWKTLENSKESWYTLTKNHHISSGTLSRIKNGKDISTKTINDLCRILNCNVENILQYVPSENDQKL